MGQGNQPAAKFRLGNVTGAGDVVIVAVNETDSDATCLIDLSGYRPFWILA